MINLTSGRFCDRPTWSRLSVVFLGPRANAELVPKFHVALYASHAALPMVTLKISPCTRVTLTFDFDFGLDQPAQGGYGWGSLTPRRRSNCQTKKLKYGGPAPERTARQTVGRTVTWNLTCIIALQITDPSSRQRGRPTWKIKKVIVTQINLIYSHLLQEGQDTKTNWPTDRRSQCDFDYRKRTQCPGVYLGHLVPGGYKYGNLALQVGGESQKLG
jgi:hypothetical protein